MGDPALSSRRLLTRATRRLPRNPPDERPQGAVAADVSRRDTASESLEEGTPPGVRPTSRRPAAQDAHRHIGLGDSEKPPSGSRAHCES